MQHVSDSGVNTHWEGSQAQEDYGGTMDHLSFSITTRDWHSHRTTWWRHRSWIQGIMKEIRVTRARSLLEVATLVELILSDPCLHASVAWYSRLNTLVCYIVSSFTETNSMEITVRTNSYRKGTPQLGAEQIYPQLQHTHNTQREIFFSTQICLFCYDIFILFGQKTKWFALKF